ncbi:MAG: M48 family metallopeptidase [Candidatus Coproplasma sp.]
MIKIKYELIRSNRKTLCISIKDNKVIVRAPLRMSITRIESFVRQKSDWIIKQLSKDDVYKQLSSYKYILVKGEMLPLIVGGENKITKKCVCVKSLTEIPKLYLDSFGDEFLKIFMEISKSSGLMASNVRFKSYKARWGCCDVKKEIIFNYKLLMLPTDLWRCVIVHELCHTVFMDHSKNFHALAKTVMPSYADVHKKLKNYTAVTRIY